MGIGGAACEDAAAALERHPLVSEAAVTTLHSRVLGFVILKPPLPTGTQPESPSAVLQVTAQTCVQSLFVALQMLHAC